MSNVILSKAVCLEAFTPDGDCFHIYAGDDGGLYVEAEGKGGLNIVISDDDEAAVEARGQWVTVKVYRPEED